MTALFTILTEYSNLSQEWLWAAFLVFLRVGAAMALLPAFGEQSVPQRVRLALAICFTAVVFPAIAPRIEAFDGPFTLPMASEVIAGLAIGIGLRLFIWALQIAGTMAAQSTSLSQLFGGQGAEPQPAMSNLFVMAGLALAVMSGLHVQVAKLFILSYDVLPPGQLTSGNALAAWGIPQVGSAFALAFSLAAPFIAASVIYNIALGVINRAMPQLMVVFVGAPALTLGGLALLAIATPLLLGVWLTAFESFLNDPFRISP